jgi:sn-glycerol 3-phosphate transport system substrate-binding protein
MKKIHFKSLLTVMTLVVLLITSACGTKDSSSNADKSSTSPAASTTATAAATDAKKDPVKVIWWHSMSGDLGKVADKLVSDFNASQKEAQVEAVFQGTYDESINKLKASMDTKSGPSLIQVYEIGSRFMIDSKAITPVQKFIDEDKFDMSQLEENITDYYSTESLIPCLSIPPIRFYITTRTCLKPQA